MNDGEQAYPTITKGVLKLSVRGIRFLFVFYILLCILGLLLTMTALLYERMVVPLSITESSLIGGIGCSLLGSTVFYLRKLYKSCIRGEIILPSTSADAIQSKGVFYYFTLRPLFAIVFSVLIHLTLKASVSFMSVKEVNLSEGFIFLTMFLSFFAGFAAGDFLNIIEARSEGVISKILR
jgi:hypothetical protein